MLALSHICGQQVFGASDSFKGSYEVYLLIPDVTISPSHLSFSKQSDYFFPFIYRYSSLPSLSSAEPWDSFFRACGGPLVFKSEGFFFGLKPAVTFSQFWHFLLQWGDCLRFCVRTVASGACWKSWPGGNSCRQNGVEARKHVTDEQQTGCSGSLAGHWTPQGSV